MKAMWVLLGLLVTGCVESNPQPSPGGPDAWNAADLVADLVTDGAVPTDSTDLTPPLEVVDTIDADVPCVPDCDGKECGDDGCGGGCGKCPLPLLCDDGTCTEPGPGEFGALCFEDADCVSGWCTQIWDSGRCTVLCVEECPEPLNCERFDWVEGGFGLCVPDCEPDCHQKECGWDGCGGSCGLCPLIQDECTDGVCVCIPDCEGKECCSDGCGGSCGSCSWPYICEDHECVCDYSVFPQIPVCDWSALETYPDWCEAEVSGIDDYDMGPCPMECVQGFCEAFDLLSGPVCGLGPGGSGKQTYDTLCALKCNVAYPPGNEDCISLDDCPDIVKMGPCPGYCPGSGCEASYNPVCAADGVTYWNYCCFVTAMEVLAADEEELWALIEQMYFCQGECVEDLLCPDVPMACNPVCGFDKWGQQISFINAQILDCLGGLPLYDATCCDGVSLEEAWVCADVDGTFEAFLNPDVLMCTDIGTPVLYEVPQDDQGGFEVGWCEDCQCDLSLAGIAPVCSVEWNTWPNSCVAACEDEEVLCSTSCEACPP